MRWEPKDYSPPNPGDERTDEKFALLPRRLSDGYTVWLEWYVQRDRFVRDIEDDGSVTEFWYTIKTNVTPFRAR